MYAKLKESMGESGKGKRASTGHKREETSLDVKIIMKKISKKIHIFCHRPVFLPRAHIRTISPLPFLRVV